MQLSQCRPTRLPFSSKATLRCRATLARPVSAASVASKSITDTMADLKANGKVAFIPFIVAGDPCLDTTSEALKRLDRAGATDPLADGPVIQNAATRALEKGCSLDQVLAMLAKTSPEIKAPVVLFTYYNPIMRRGMDQFCKQAKAAGASGLLVPDIPMEETVEIRQVCNSHGMELVLLSTPTTPPARMKQIAEKTQGFVYLVSVTGVTGTQENMSQRVEGLVSALHEVTDKPVCVGFGVSKPEHSAQIAAWGAEGVICGSALVRALGESASPAEGLDRMEALAISLMTPAAVPRWLSICFAPASLISLMALLSIELELPEIRS
eukprot:gene11454-34164_t